MLDSEVLISKAGGDPAPRSSGDKTLLKQIWLVIIFQGYAILGERRAQSLQTDRTAFELNDYRFENLSVHIVKSDRVHVQRGQRGICDQLRNSAVGLHFRIITDPSK